MKKIIFTRQDVGCWIDGTYGSSHRRVTLADMLALLPETPERLAVQAELAQGPSDDYGEELGAIDMLQEHTSDGYVWEQYGDLCLIPEGELE